MKLTDEEITKHRDEAESEVLRRAMAELWEARKKYKDWDDGQLAIALEDEAAQRIANMMRNGDFPDLEAAAVAIEEGAWRTRLGIKR